MINIFNEAIEAEGRIRKYIRETPLEHSPYLSRIGQGSAFLKLENTQITGSFKLRGALNKLLSLSPDEKKQGIITASSGNHGMAVAYGLKTFNIRGRIFLPANASPTKIKALQDYGAQIELFGDDCVKAEIHAREEAEREGVIYISPYNDPQIIGGQATVALEITHQLKDIHSVLIPVGGGGLIAGIAGYLKALNKNVNIIGCQPENSAVMFESLKAGKIIEMESKPTISEGSAGGIEKGTVTFNFCRDYVDDFILVSEEEIKEAIRIVFEKHFMIIEGAAALSVASFLKGKERFKDKNTVLIISGAKLSTDALKSVFCEGREKHS
ncbi:MAG: threonine/serine dehydratase [Candidatus Aminicenantes bacterium]|nr:threonine/serine dehydratase [Candidatus Aminicenantes bacterium]